MASSSHYHYHKDDDHEFDSMFEDIFENPNFIPEPKKRKPRIHIERNREEGHTKLWNDYFCETPTYPHNIFRRRFRMNKTLFLRIMHRMSNEIEYFQPREDATGRSSLSPLQKCTAAIRQLAYGGGSDTVDEYVRLGETTARKCLHHFTAGIVQLFGEEYLRRPTPEDLERLLYIGEQRGFPGMVGSIDCMHWEWKNCPTAWKGMYSRGTNKPTIVLEAVASYDLWIWHAFFGAPGTMNDLNILDRSPVFDDIINGIAPEVNFYVNGNQYHLAYYLTDAVRKDVERAFGVLQARFAVVRNPSQLWDKEKIATIMRACIILHNMIVEDERSSSTQYDVDEFQEREDVDTFSVNMPSHLGNIIDRRTSVRNTQAHHKLQNDLIDNIWAKFGHLPNNF
uniref:DDE Tnp4 domain-containing protein n=1 Tax=Brassica oleracea var. oleracea TaxID=109376 RepID=A0A0D3C914_BRAOL